MKYKLLASAVLAGFLGMGVAHAQTAATEVTIATAGPMTGEYAPFGAQMKAGIEQAVEDLNAAGGVMGKKIKLVVGDDACDPKQAVGVANKFVSDKVVFVAGHFCSGSSIPASKVYSEEGILQISPASTNPKFTDEGAWNTFRVCGRDDQQGMVAAKYIAEKFKGKKVGIIDDKSAYGKGLAEETKKNLNAAGVKEAIYESYTAKEKDYSALVSKLKAAAVDVLYVGGYHTEAGLIVRQMRDQGMKTVLIAGDALNTNEFWSIAGPAGEGTLFTFSPDPRKKASAADVVKKFAAKKIDPEGYVLYTYGAVQAWATAATKAGSFDSKKVAEELKKSGPWKTVLGDFSFDKKGDVTAPGYVFYEWKNGKYGEM